MPGQESTAVALSQFQAVDQEKIRKESRPPSAIAQLRMPGMGVASVSVKDIIGVPPYPNAARAFGAQDPELYDMQMVTYATPDDPATALDFYRQQMPLHMWEP